MYRNVHNIIVAAGSGSRFGGKLPKQYCSFCNRPLIMTTIERFRDALPGSQIILVINHEHQNMWKNLCEIFGFSSPETVFGGKSRWESVKNAINSIGSNLRNDTIITVHDGARPLITSELIHRVIKAILDGHQGAIPVIPVTDSLRVLTDGQNSSMPVDREKYRTVQTPQAFNGTLLSIAYTAPYRNEFTDDASVMAASGFTEMELVEGDPRNIKITHPTDIKIAEILNSL